ncbi:response regulator [Sabulilitoribacter multivorans]|uniref:histidine kinase n=1 Tax=Flaviramulus multivorans TaxID=1304750 RepID=A0ABS9IL70_9FLAO|nr:response regulator [Flaviramulus multivorans]MCF7561344.1 response regulator [Flaviramulus multivorans]
MFTFYGQEERKIDSLKNIIANTAIDSTKVLEYLELGNLFSDKDSSYKYYQKALILSRKKRFPKGISHSLVNIAIWKNRYENSDSALVTFKRAIKELHEYDFLPGIANHYLRLGDRYARERELDSATKYKNLGFDLAFKSKDPSVMLTAIIMGGQNKITGKNTHESALINYLKGDSICKTNNNAYYSRKCADIYEKIGNLFFNLTEFEKAKKYYYEAKSIHEFLGHPDGLNDINFLISGIYREQKKYHEALNYIDPVIKYYRLEMPNNVNLIQALPERGNIYYNLGQLDLAEKDYLEFLEMAKQRENNFYISRANISLGNFYYNINYYKKALLYSQQGFNLAKNRKDLRSQLLAIKVMIKANKELANYKDLSENWENYVQLRDSFDYAKLRTQVNELETKYQTKKKEQEIALLTSQNELIEQQKKNQRNLLLAGIGLTSLAGMFFFFLYQNRQKTNKKLKEIDKLKSNFFANISHEFRTPLTLISAPIEKKLNSKKLNDTDQKDFEMVQRNSARLLNLVNQLLDLSKLESGSLKLHVKQGNLTKLLKSITSSFSHLAEQKQIKYNVQIEDFESAWFDRDVIEKTTINLLSNAFKYTPENGKVSFNAKKENDKLVMLVENNGALLTKDKVAKIFNRFYQGDDSSEGVGIGLSLVKELVSFSNGSITVENKRDENIQFKVVLPVQKKDFKIEELSIENHDDDFSLAKTNQQQNVITDVDENELLNEDNPLLLIVEDNADVRSFIKNSFSEKYKVIEAENGKIGLEKALEFIPDIIISDIMMPEIDGMELCKHLKEDERTCHIPIILLTAKAGEEDQYKGLDTGADAYITKPFKLRLVETRVQNLIDSRRNLRERYSQEVILKPKDLVITNLDEQFLEKVQNVLDEKLIESSFTSEEFSKAVGMSRMQLHRKLKALTDLSASEFIRSQRLKLAISLLEKSDVNISEIAYKVGFNDHAYFSKCFKEAYGCSPSEYHNNKT